MIGTNGERESEKSVLSEWFDDIYILELGIPNWKERLFQQRAVNWNNGKGHENSFKNFSDTT